MSVDNKTILIIGLIIMAIISLYYTEKDIALAISSGLVGYLSKDVISEPSTQDTTGMETLHGVGKLSEVSEPSTQDTTEEDDGVEYIYTESNTVDKDDEV